MESIKIAAKSNEISAMVPLFDFLYRVLSKIDDETRVHIKTSGVLSMLFFLSCILCRDGI